ncbi:DUF4030 domain-containing protein [Ferdinandcohnia quinoae]|uniref:DUF4030 domain-containing protein n=1 Tax=Fredinandcohnia quinoae TaxID=2918902 RepID=A0AAW5E2Z6_9BACI|nr:DUF4030 domain-containing protein [Fredinandcohnia sp. SECRCQ15]MCH1624262.1 DUF4030 domain-containing protein [Fredinandcohnia sp. SECRCQ15]
MDKDLEQVKEHYGEHYFNDEIANRIKNRVHASLRDIESVNEPRHIKNKWSLWKKIFYSSGAAIIALGLVIGSGFVSQAMAEVLQKIPYLNSIYESKQKQTESITAIIREELSSRNYNFGISHYPHEKKIEVFVEGTKEYYETIKEDVSKIIIDRLYSENHGAYTVIVTNLNEGKSPYKYQERTWRLRENIEMALKAGGYEFISAIVGIDDNERGILLEIPETERRVDEIKQVVQSVVLEYEKGTFEIEVNRIDPEKAERKQKWEPVLDTILSGMKGYRIEQIGYSFDISPLPLSIHTSIDSTDKNAKEQLKEIESMVKSFLESEDIKAIIKDEPYMIEMYDKDNRKIN